MQHKYEFDELCNALKPQNNVEKTVCECSAEKSRVKTHNKLEGVAWVVNKNTSLFGFGTQ